MELQRIVRAQADIQPNLEEIRQRVPLVRQEQRIITERTHRKTDLLEIEEILESGDLAEEDSMGNGVGREEGRGEMVGVASFPTVRSEHKGVWANENQSDDRTSGRFV